MGARGKSKKDPRIALISATAVNRLRRAASKISGEICDAAEKGYDGWNVAPYDPNRLFEAFPRLRMREGSRLASYQFKEGSNGNGFVFAIPKGNELPPPPVEGLRLGWRETGEVSLDDSRAAVPSWAVPVIGPFLEGDGSPESHFEASLFVRELRELGALWHGAGWSTHKILASGQKDLERLAKDEGPPPSEWAWMRDMPTEWRPAVRTSHGGAVTVDFYTFSGLGRFGIYLHRDTFSEGYCFETTQEAVATGGRGYVF